jgi:hypothetical protein
MTKFTEQERETAIRALVQSHGNVARAKDYLESRGLSVSTRSLQDYRDSERYAELADNPEWKVDEQAESAEYLVAMADEVQVRLMGELLAMPREKLQAMSPNVIAMAAAKAATVKGINFDKAADARGRPARPSGEDKSLLELMEGLTKKFGKVIQFAPELKAIDSTAKDITPDS